MRVVDEIKMARDEILSKAYDIVAQNEGCFSAQWILDNPDKNLDNYSLHYQYMDDGSVKFWIDLK